MSRSPNRSRVVAGRRRVPDLPPQLRRFRRRWHRGPARHPGSCRPPRATSVWMSSGSRRSTRHRGMTTGIRHQRLPVDRPSFGDPRGLRSRSRGAAPPRDQTRHGPGGQPHLRRAPVVRRVGLPGPRQPDATGTGGVRLATGFGRRIGAEPTNWEWFFSGSAWALDAAVGRVLPASLLPQTARPQLGEPGGAGRRLRDDALVARSRRRRVPHGCHQPDLEGRLGLPDGEVAPGRQWGDGFPHYGSGPRIHEFLQEMQRSSAVGTGTSPSVRCPA